MRAIAIAIIVACLAVLAPELRAEFRVDRRRPTWLETKVHELRHERDWMRAELRELRAETRNLRRVLRHRPSSLEALRLASITYDVPFSLLYRRASCESTGSRPAYPPSERTLLAGAKNPRSTASGLLQFLDSTWASTPFRREDVFSPYANALAAGWMIGEAGRAGEWVCK